MLEFALTNEKHRKASLEKIDKLIKVVTEFRNAVYAEAQLIEKNYGRKEGS